MIFYFSKNRIGKYMLLVFGFIFFGHCTGQEKPILPKEKNGIPSPISFPTTKWNPPEVDSVFRFEKGVISMHEDRNGNFWFGTLEEGLCRFDGKSFSYFSKKNGLPSDQIQSIQEDAFGNIFFRTGNGICYFDGKSFTNIGGDQQWNAIKNKNQLNAPSSAEWKLSKNDFWFPVNNNGVLRYDGGQLSYLAFPHQKEDVFLKNEPHLFPYLVLVSIKDQDGKIWFGTASRGVVSFDGKNFEYFNPDNFGEGTIRSLFQDKNGNYWVGSNGGDLYRYDGKQFENFTKKHQLENPNPEKSRPRTLSRVWAIEQDDEGNLWFGTADSGAWKYDGKSLTNYTPQDGLNSFATSIIYKDRQGRLWFGSGVFAEGRLQIFNGKTFEDFNGE